MRVVFILSLFISLCSYGQIYQPATATVFGQHNLRTKSDSVLHVPEYNDSIKHTNDASGQILIINGSLYYFSGVLGYWIKTNTGAATDTLAIHQGGNSFGSTISIGSNDNKNVSYIRNGAIYLTLGGGREYFGTSQNYWIDTVGNMFGQLWKGLNLYASNSMNIPYDTLPPPSGVWDTGYIALLSNNRADNHLWLRSGHENGTHNTIWKQLPFSSDITGNTTSNGVIPTGTKAAIPFYNGTHSISYTNNALMDSVTGAISVQGKRLADTTDIALKLNKSNFIDSLTGRNATLLGNTTTGTGSTIVLSGSPTLTLPNIAAVNVSGGIVSFPTGASGTLSLADSTVWQTKYRSDTMRTNVYNALAGKQATLTAGNTITITSNTINVRNDTISLASFGAGSGVSGDTAAFSTSSLYGSFYNSGSDTLIITAMQIGLQGTSPSIAATVWVNDTLAATAGGFQLVTGGTTATNIYIGTNVTSFTNTKIPPNVWVWVQTPTVTTKPTYFTLTLIGYKKRV